MSSQHVNRDLDGRTRRRAATRRTGVEPTSAISAPQARVLELQQALGNAAVARLIARQDGGTDAGTVAPPAPVTPRRESTPYGEFDVYPDDFFGALPAADPTHARRA
jgi:hypothetical protein